ncbi:MAG TPA: hypothetical protein VFH69_06570 [Gemmatimonadota bacterium]|nr:hypothetical protein [Gemmatimonadota bacterium]
MTRAGRTVLGTSLASVAILVIGAATRVPWTATPADRALLRLSWRAESETMQECRSLTEEELAELPVHMRTPEVCERKAVPYLLKVDIDGRTLLNDTLHGSGAREDRPVYVFREFALRPGTHAVDVEFLAIGAEDAGMDEDREDDRFDQEDDEESDDEDDDEDDDENDDENDDEEERTGVRLTFSDTILFSPREVALVSYDPDLQTLVRVAGR